MKKILFLFIVSLLISACGAQTPLKNNNSNTGVKSSNGNINSSGQVNTNQDLLQEKVNLCLATLNDPTVPARDDRQLNMLKCFKNLSQQKFSADICKNLKSDYLIGCSAGFAKGQNDLSICDMTFGVNRGDCLEIQEWDF